MKKLTAHTIIPKELYIARAADRQLHAIVMQMGRPGYVLVARQMGKTNLLLHTKRTLENDRNLFVYIDLSRSFESERECFRYIIDVAIDSHPSHFDEFRSRFENDRAKASAAPYREHEKELLTLLAKCKERLVIILDEIDYLTNTAFSDRIFAQIRSTYFNRASYPLFSKLTYVLSGVAEPTQLIKDKKVSPFNIGEKIFLDDFTNEEFLEFLSRANLTNLSPETKERIYFWTRGNPRMTWDVCSEIEDAYLRGATITTAHVDTTVRSLYLERFDRPPIDHIRQLAIDDKQVREAILVIRRRSGTVSDDVKARLYLAGITASTASGNSLRLKNPVIDTALSDTWLKEVELSHGDLLKTALESYQNGDYIGALDLLKSYLQGADFPPELKSTYFGVAAWCAYFSREPELAISFLDRADIQHSGSRELKVHHSVIRGMCLLDLGRSKSAAECFAAALSQQPAVGDYYDGSLGLSEAEMLDKDLYNYDSIRARLVKIIEELETATGLQPRDLDRYRRSAFIHLAHNERLGGQAQMARQYLAEALEIGGKASKTQIRLFYAKFVRDEGERTDPIIRQACDDVLSGEVAVVTDSSGVETGLRARDALELSFEAYFRFGNQMFEALIAKLRNLGGKHDYSDAFLRFALAAHGNRTGRTREAEILFREIVSNSHGDIDREFLVESYRFLVRRIGGLIERDILLGYLATLESNSSLSIIDLGLLANGLPMQLSARRLAECIALGDWAERMRTKTPEDLRINLIFFCLYRVIALVASNVQIQVAVTAARAVLSFEGDIAFSKKESRIISDADLRTALDYARSVIASGSVGSVHEPSRNSIVNVRYVDGRQLSGVRYRRVRADILAGLCTLY